jgi:hypothetical protein
MDMDPKTTMELMELLMNTLIYARYKAIPDMTSRTFSVLAPIAILSFLIGRDQRCHTSETEGRMVHRDSDDRLTLVRGTSPPEIDFAVLKKGTKTALAHCDGFDRRIQSQTPEKDGDDGGKVLCNGGDVLH